MDLQLNEFLAGLAGSLVDAQLVLDERGRDSIDAFADTGVLPTVLTWSSLRMELPVSVGLRPKSAAGDVSVAAVAPEGSARLALGVRYLPAEQGVDDPGATS